MDKKQIKSKKKFIKLFFEKSCQTFGQDKKILLAEDWIEKLIDREEYEMAEEMRKKRDLLLGNKPKFNIINKIKEFINKIF